MGILLPRRLAPHPKPAALAASATGGARVGFDWIKKQRAMGIEPTYPAWEASVLPLNYARVAAYRRNFNSFFKSCQSAFRESQGLGLICKSSERVSLVYGLQQLAYYGPGFQVKTAQKVVSVYKFYGRRLLGF